MTRPVLCASLLPTWLSEACTFGRNEFERAGALYDSWRTFARARDAEPGSPPEFARAMAARGFVSDQLAGDRTRIRWGLRLKAVRP